MVPRVVPSCSLLASLPFLDPGFARFPLCDSVVKLQVWRNVFGTHRTCHHWGLGLTVYFALYTDSCSTSTQSLELRLSWQVLLWASGQEVGLSQIPIIAIPIIAIGNQEIRRREVDRMYKALSMFIPPSPFTDLETVPP